MTDPRNRSYLERFSDSCEPMMSLYRNRHESAFAKYAADHCIAYVERHHDCFTFCCPDGTVGQFNLNTGCFNWPNPTEPWVRNFIIAAKSASATGI